MEPSSSNDVGADAGNAQAASIELIAMTSPGATNGMCTRLIKPNGNLNPPNRTQPTNWHSCMPGYTKPLNVVPRRTKSPFLREDSASRNEQGGFLTECGPPRLLRHRRNFADIAQFYGQNTKKIEFSLGLGGEEPIEFSLQQGLPRWRSYLKAVPQLCQVKT